MTSLKIAICQKDAVVGDKAANLETVADVVDGGDADIVIFPENFITGYMINDDVYDLAETLDGPSVKEVSNLAVKKDCCIVVGMPEKSRDIRGHIYNSAVVAYPNGKAYSYRKMHLPNFGPFNERLYYTPGNELPIFTHRKMKFGLTVCYDIFFPELSKSYALGGADLIINISASPTQTREFFEAMTRARAIENTVFFAYSNNVGLQGNMEFWGGSRLIGPKGNIINTARPLDRTVLETTIRLEDLEVARRNRPTLRDTREGMFQSFQPTIR